MEMGGDWKFVLVKGGGGKMRGGCPEMKVVILYWGFSGDFSWCNTGKISWYVCNLNIYENNKNSAWYFYVNKHVL